MEADPQGRLAGDDTALLGRHDQRCLAGHDVEGRHDAAVVGGEGLGDSEVDLRVAALADQPAVHGRGGTGVEHPVDAVEEVLFLGLRTAGRPGVTGILHRIGVRVAVGVAEPGVGEGLAGRPLHGVRHLRPDWRRPRGSSRGARDC